MDTFINYPGFISQSLTTVTAKNGLIHECLIHCDFVANKSQN